MNPNQPITKKEALRYNRDALEGEIARRKRNIKLFQAEIAKDEAEIDRLFQIIKIIDASKK